jgi:hypothetical protein
MPTPGCWLFLARKNDYTEGHMDNDRVEYESRRAAFTRFQEMK